MKTCLAFIFALFYFFQAIAQLPEIEYDGFTPKWYFYSKDPNFVPGSDPNIDEYNTFTVGQHATMTEEFAYPFFPGYDNLRDYDGGIYHKVRLSDGEIVWTRILNTNNGEQQGLFFTDFLLPDGSISLIGKKRTNLSVRLPLGWKLVADAQPWVKILNDADGSDVIEYYNEKDTLGVRQILYGNGFFYSDNFSKLKRLSNNSGAGVEIFDFNYDTKEFELAQVLPYQYNMPKEMIKSYLYNGIRKIGTNRLVRQYYLQSKDESLHENEAYLEYYDLIGDEFQLTKRTSILHYFKLFVVPQGSPYDFMATWHSESGEMAIIKAFRSHIEKPNFRAWVLWLDEEGNEKLYLGDMKLPNHDHIYEVPIPFYLDKTGVYMLGGPSYTGKEGVDIVRLKPDGVLEVLGSLTTGDTRRSSGLRVNMNANGDIVYMHIWDNKYPTVMGMHISDFGISISTDDEEKSLPSDVLLSVSPNPVSELLTIHVTDDRYHTGTAYIYDMQGKLMSQQKVSHGENLQVSSLNNGPYIMHYNPDVRPGYFLTAKFIKI